MNINAISGAALYLSGLYATMQNAQLVSAQNPDLRSASVEACGASGSISIRVAGITTTTPMACFNQVEQTVPGINDQFASSFIFNVPGLQNVLTIGTSHNRVEYTTQPKTTTLTANAQITNISLLQNLVSLGSANNELICNSTQGNSIECNGESTIGPLLINGQQVSLPNPIPPNTVIPVNGNIQVTVAGIILPVTIPLSGTLTFNSDNDSGLVKRQSDGLIACSPVRLKVEGTAKGGVVRVESELATAISIGAFDPSPGGNPNRNCRVSAIVRA
jgi:hypothetical protein